VNWFRSARWQSFIRIRVFHRIEKVVENNRVVILKNIKKTNSSLSFIDKYYGSMLITLSAINIFFSHLFIFVNSWQIALREM